MNIAAALEAQIVARPAAVALHAPHGGRDGAGARRYQAVTFAELGQRIRRLTAALGELGITPGERCALMVPPSIEFVELTFALFAAGAVPVFVDPGIGIKNLGQCLAQAEPTTFLGISKAHVARLLFGWARRSLQIWVTIGPRLGWSGVTLERLRQQSAATADIVPTAPEDLAAILFTSGSTGVPKGAVYTHGMFTAQLARLKESFGIEPGEVDLCTFPLFALFGPALGMTSVIPVMDSTRPARVSPREIDEPVRRFGATNLFGSPALLNRVSRGLITTDTPQPPTVEPRWPTMRRVLSAGAPVAPAILERMATLLPPRTEIFTPYGATEALPVAVIGSDEVLRETRARTAAGAGTCVGRPVAGLDVRIVKISDKPLATWCDADVLATGEIGEIVVHGPQVTQTYFRRPDLTALAKIPDRSRGGAWHRMGDVGYFDETGRLWFCGRKSQRVVTASRTYFTDQVEGIFNARPEIFRSALVGVILGGQVEPVICLERELGHPMSDAELIARMREHAQTYDLTRGISRFLIPPRFPVDIRHNSKIFREQLAVWATRCLRRRRDIPGAGGRHSPR